MKLNINDRIDQREILKLVLFLYCSLMCSGLIWGQEKKYGEQALSYLKTLASDEFQGRKTGTDGGKRAEEYVAQKFKEFGLQAWNGSYYQEFEFPCHNFIPGCKLDLIVTPTSSKTFTYNEDYYFYQGSGNVEVTAEVVFVGYGIHTPDRGYDDYENVDIKGKIALAMHGTPPAHGEKFTGKDAFFVTKAANARKLGAVALLLYNDPDRLVLFPTYKVWSVPVARYFADFVIGNINHTVFNEIFAGTGEFAVDLKDELDLTGQTFSFPTTKIVHLKSRATYDEKAKGANILGFIPGRDPNLKVELISIGAHLDGGGMDPDGVIFNGAEDNASGTAVVMEIAERLMKEKFKPLRTVLFAGWAAEEQGLHGSRFFVANPILPLEQNVLNLCVDNVGWGEGEFKLFSATNFPELYALVKKSIDPDLLACFIPHGLGGSDAFAFQEKGVPAFFAHTTQSQPYNHFPLDDAKFINPKALENVTKFMYQAIKSAANYKGNLINPNRAAIFKHRYASVVDYSEDLVDFTKKTMAGKTTQMAKEYERLRNNGIDICVQTINSAGFKESMLQIHDLKKLFHGYDKTITLLTTGSQLKTVEEGRNFLTAFKLKETSSFDQNISLLEILHSFGARIISLDCSASASMGSIKMFSKSGALSPWGMELIAKINKLGFILELENPSAGIVDNILAVAKQPIVICYPKMEKSFLDQFFDSENRHKIYFCYNYDLKSKQNFAKLTEYIDLIIERNIVSSFLLNPSNYSESDNYQQFTVSLFKHGYSEEIISKILGLNFIDLFAKICKN